jgi:hypothetical protein
MPGQPGSERLTARVVLADGQEHSATAASAAAHSVDGGYTGGTPTLEGSISGRVTECDVGEVVVDICDPSTGCAPMLYRLIVDAPGLSLAIPAGREVKVSWSFTAGGMVWSDKVAILDGSDASVTDGTRALWLWAVDPGSNGDVAGLFRVERQELFCNPSPGTEQGCGGGEFPPDDYAFRFSAISGQAEVTLATGQSGTLVVATTSGQQQHLTVHDLRSYQTSHCDDYWNWAWWAAGHPGPTGDPE